MGIRIESLSVNGLGPIASLQMAFKDVNLIYGKNEQGKTYLVEYILRSLFKNATKTRVLTDSGQVIVSGLNGSSSSFHPKSKQKVEDLISLPAGVPVDLARLCIIRGGELSMTSTPGETITRTVLKDYLSDQRILDRIQDQIPAAVQESKFEDGKVQHKRHIGLIKNWKESQQTLERVNEILAAVDADYSQGVAQKARIELEGVSRKIAQQQRAKRAHAFKLAYEIQQIENELSRFPEEMMAKASLSINLIEGLNSQLLKARAKVEELHHKVEHYQWLKSAIEECEKRPEGLKSGMEQWFAVLAGVFVLIGLLTAPQNSVISLGAGALAILFIFLTVSQVRNSLRSSGDRQEVLKIYTEYEGKFKSRASSIVTLKSTFELLQASYFELGSLTTQISEKEEELQKNKLELTHFFEGLGYYDIELDRANIVIAQVQEQRSKLSDQLANLNIELAKTNVTPEEYLEESENIAYDPLELGSLMQQAHSLEETISGEENKLQALKQRVCDLTRDKVTARWEELIDHLRSRQERAREECKSLHAQIVGGIFVTEAIAELRKQEDENIYSALASKSMAEPIRAITPYYTGIDLDGEELIVFNDVQRFQLSAMSTGAKEQVLMALRIGLTRHVLGDQKMFLILDDAFQHSDWNRRECLVDEMAALAMQGWQIFYFSMDDHIKQLFEERVKPVVNERYQAFELTGIG